jgi:uncharacterized protein YdhG (YjbR/CyaY superfamily)
MKKPPTTIDAWLEQVGDDQRAALQKLRKQIRAAAPNAVECINYGVPTFKLDGRSLVHFGAGQHHCAFYTGKSPIVTFAKELAAFETSTGTVRFTPTKPIPPALVARIVKARIEENAARLAAMAIRRRKAR